MTIPPIGPHHALFLDIDGTLVDLAQTPDLVVVPAGLPATLRRLRDRLGGALAILSGRKMADIDRLVGAGLACAAEHGAIVRGPDGVVTVNVKRPAHFAQWLQTLNQCANEMPGVLIEKKQFSLVAHYRNARAYEAELGQIVERLLAACDDAVLLLAHCAFELKPRGGNKGGALAHFMAHPPFTGRTPLFVGDDVTDEPAIRQAITLGGAGLHVARDFGGSTQAVRDWLEAK